jgi:hypothetical protein
MGPALSERQFICGHEGRISISAFIKAARTASGMGRDAARGRDLGPGGLPHEHQ